jgi:membrane-bound acyltransferase YfiQ involved in biofilm formation
MVGIACRRCRHRLETFLNGRIVECLVIGVIGLNTVVLAVGEPGKTGSAFSKDEYDLICIFVVCFFVLEFIMKLFAMGVRVCSPNISCQCALRLVRVAGLVFGYTVLWHGIAAVLYGEVERLRLCAMRLVPDRPGRFRVHQPEIDHRSLGRRCRKRGRR